MADEFVRMTKDGATIAVHPSVVADHKRLGWMVVNDEAPGEPVAAETLQAQPEPKPKRKK